MEDAFNLDVVCLGQILPPEVWILVATKLLKKDPDDFTNLVNSSVFFRDLFATQRTTLFFENVFPIVTTIVWKKEGLQGFSISEVLKLRGVCSHWVNAILKLICEKFQCFGDGSKDNKIAPIGDAFKEIQFNNKFTNLIESISGVSVKPNKSVHNFLLHFGKTHQGTQPNKRNPLIWNSLVVNIFTQNDINANIENYQLFLESISLMLSKYGGHFEEFSLKIHSYHFFQTTSLMQKWLLEMPNVKKFSFLNDSDDTWTDELAELNLEEHLQHNPIPKLKFLKNVKVRDFPAPMFNQLIRKNSHISVLSINVVEDGYDIFTISLPNLKKLTLNFCPPSIFEKLRSSNVEWPLETLKLMFAGDDFIGCSAIFQLIQKKFSKTLVNFKLALNEEEDDKKDAQIWNDCKSSRLDLPKLRKFQLDMYERPVCLDFLLPMKLNLEELQVSCGRPFTQKVNGTSGTIIQFVGFEKKMLESNIWVIFRKLRTIEVTDDMDDSDQNYLCYFRKDWELSNEYP